MKRLTLKREKEIRKILECHGGLIEPIASELLAEIDALRAEIQDWKGTLAHANTEASIKIGGLEQECAHLKGRPKKLDEVKIMKLRLAGKSLAEIADKFGVTRGAIQSVIRRCRND